MPYIADTNSHSLSAPPVWWIAGLAAFDPDLCVLPSRQKPVYLLARRRKLSAGILPPSPQFIGDVGMLHAHDLVSCDKCFTVKAWSMGALQELIGILKSCDTWAVDKPLDETDVKRAAFEGPTKAAQMADANDEAERQRIDRENRETMYHASGDGWRSLKVRTGQRMFSAGKSQAGV